MSINKSSRFSQHSYEQINQFSDLKSIFKKSTNVMRQREMIEQLQKIVIESDEQNKRLHQQIVKITQRQKNTTLYYQSKISQLESIIEKQMVKIQALQNQKLKRDQNFIQSKLIKTSMNESKRYHLNEQKQNINTLNINHQQCNQEECTFKEEEIKKYLAIFTEKLEYLLHSMQIRQMKSKNEQYIRQLQFEKQNKRGLAGKDSLLLLKSIHQKMILFENTMQNISNQFHINDPFLVSFKNIKKMQQGLLKIPFLENINLNERKQQTDDILLQARESKKRILSALTNR